MLRSRRTAGVAVAIAALLAWPPPASAVTLPPLDQITASTTQVAFGLRRPTALTAPDDSSQRLLIAEKAGRVRVFHPDTGLASAPLLDLTDRVDPAGEAGLIGIVTSPDFAQTHTLYVVYTSPPDTTLTLSRFVLDSADQNPVPTAGEEVLLTQAHAEFRNHYGGQLAFGPDGFLYWSFGDGGDSGDSLGHAQDLGSLLGKIVRLDVSRSCGELPYCVPEDNPFVSDPRARPEIWAYGMRNPWKFSFDPADGSLWIGDVGQATAEEVNRLPAGSAGANLGWSCREGTEVFNPERCSTGVEYVDPVFTHRTSFDGCAVIGGHVYHGTQFADLVEGTYILTDYCSAAVWAVRPNGDGTYGSARIAELPIAQPTALEIDSSGEFYLVNDLPGQLHRLSFASTQ
jgi:glucose/arabinose dehydrogenase